MANRKSRKLAHPIQPLYLDGGQVWFKENPIVRFLLEAGPYDMNKLAAMPFDNEDREQFAQLIGYNTSGFSELSYVSNQTYTKVQQMEEVLYGH